MKYIYDIAANGLEVRIPEDKYPQWKKGQEMIKAGKLKADPKFAKELREKIVMDNNHADSQPHIEEIFDVCYQRCIRILDNLDKEYLLPSDYELELFPALYYVWDISVILSGLDRIKYTYPIFDHIMNNNFLAFQVDKDIFTRRVDLYEKISNNKQNPRGELFFGDTSQFDNNPIFKVLVAFSDILINPDCADNYDSAPLSVWDIFSIAEIEKALGEIFKNVGEMMEQIASFPKSRGADEHEAPKCSSNQQNKDHATKSISSFWSNHKEKLMSKLGSVGIVLWYISNIFLTIAPFFVLDLSFWWVFIALAVVLTIPPILGDVILLGLYIWGLINVIGSSPTALVIIFYIAFAIFVIYHIISLTTALLAARE